MRGDGSLSLQQAGAERPQLLGAVESLAKANASHNGRCLHSNRVEACDRHMVGEEGGRGKNPPKFVFCTTCYLEHNAMDSAIVIARHLARATHSYTSAKVGTIIRRCAHADVHGTDAAARTHTRRPWKANNVVRRLRQVVAVFNGLDKNNLHFLVIQQGSLDQLAKALQTNGLPFPEMTNCIIFDSRGGDQRP